jgi:O-antigen/teichoic acid export membrane protein
MSSAKKDLTGQNRAVSNVVVGWLAQLVFIASGFILPRMIDQHIGMEALGVWDFAWSLIVYFDIIHSGLISSVSRFVAKHRATNNLIALNTVVSSIFRLLLFMAMIVCLLAIGSALWVPLLLYDRLGAYSLDAQWVVLVLGINLAIKLPLGVFGSVLTGCHRWDLQYGINAANRLATLLGMVITLLLGGGLIALAVAYLVCETLVLASRCSLAYQVCPGLKIKLSLACWSTTKELWRFSLKTLLPSVGDLLNNQTFSLLLVWFLGPVALAGYARPRSLLRHIQTLTMRYTYPLSPRVSAMQAMNDTHGIQALFINSCRTGAFISLPMLAILAVMGDPFLNIWMGKNYTGTSLPLILALGALPSLIQLPFQSILHGLNSHGRPGIFSFIASLTGISGAWVALAIFHLDIRGAALAVFLPFWISDLIATPVYTAKRHGLSLKLYWTQGLLQPILVVLPMTICLAISRFLFTNTPLATLGIGLASGLPILTICYWQFALSAEIKNKM